MNNKKIRWLLLIVSLWVVPLFPKAQPVEYKNDQGVLVGTSDSRLFVTINESIDHVEFQICAIGEITAAAFGFILLYDTAILRLTDPTYSYDMPIGYNFSSYPTEVISISPSFKAKFPDWVALPMQHREIIDGPAAGMKFFCAEISGSLSTSPVKLVSGEIIHIMNMYYRKVNPGTPLTTSDFGYFTEAKTPPLLTSQWIFGAYKIKLSAGRPWDNFIERPELFTYRSPSYIVTEEVTGLISDLATFNATFTRGDLIPTLEMLNAHYASADTNGRLNWDVVKKYGFIYSNVDATILVNGYSNRLKIDGVDYEFPNTTELAAGNFIRNGKKFYITPLITNNASEQSVSVSQNVSELPFEDTCYVWSLIHYTFETSNSYLFVGNKVLFEMNSTVPQAACPLSVDFEGGPYKVTSLAGLCWTANMATRHYADGNPITFARAYSCKICPDSVQTATVFGLLYTWYSAVGIPETSLDAPAPDSSGFVQGICPQGWHVPSPTELDRLNQYPAEDLRSTNYWVVAGGTNATGFNALPA
ncbi:MAG: fibrobacter succinogenes major paralogous domain-containing protein, partial [Lentimicrobiaceae bacterium]|nr:fibrobacter succinogenes major paralogous domain-containing protein [Lentimicrobiaceae bacterium]